MSKHKARVELDRSRVLCLGCTWFKWMPGATNDELREAHRLHVHASKER